MRNLQECVSVYDFLCFGRSRSMTERTKSTSQGQKKVKKALVQANFSFLASHFSFYLRTFASAITAWYLNKAVM